MCHAPWARWNPQSHTACFPLQVDCAMQGSLIFAAQRQLRKLPCAYVELLLHCLGPALFMPCTMSLPMCCLEWDSVCNEATILSHALSYASAWLGDCTQSAVDTVSCCLPQRHCFKGLDVAREGLIASDFDRQSASSCLVFVTTLTRPLSKPAN